MSRRARAEQRAYAALRRAARRAGFHVVRADHYSPIPDVDRLPASLWEEPTPMPGLELDLDAQSALLDGPLAPYLAEFRPPRDPPPGEVPVYYAANPMYGLAEGAILHALLRERKPRRVFELGAGFSSLVVDGAAARNAAEGAPLEHRIVDPVPADVLRALEGRAEIRAISATDVPIAEFAALEPGDVLFIDTTHTVRPGGDVLHLVLQALPALQPGVLVHVHDVFRPYEYPRPFAATFGLYWQEHHLLQAFLAYNERFRIVLASYALFRERRAVLARHIPELGTLAQAPSAFWFERVAP